MTNKELLNYEILNSGIKKKCIADKLGITREGFYNKVNGKVEFKASEILILQEILNLTNEKRDNIFFAKKVE